MTILQIAETFGLTEDGALRGTTQAARRRLSPAQSRTLAEAATLWGQVWNGDRQAAVLVAEAMTTSDLFVSATGQMLDRELFDQFGEVESTWRQYATATRVRNFKPKKMVDILGGRVRLARVPELDQYAQMKGATNEFTIQAAKFGRLVGWSWEAGLADDLDELRQIPNRFAQASGLTEDYAALEAIATSSTGAPSTTFFQSYDATEAAVLGYAAFDNSSTAALTSTSLQTAIESISTRRDAEGNIVPRGAGQLVLMVGPALEFIAGRIINGAFMVRTTSGTRSVDERNPFSSLVRLVVNPLLVGNSWFVLPDPNTSRPAVAVANLTGFETPDLRVANNTGTRVGGGAVSPEDGSFDEDAVWYRVRHVTGGAALDPIHTYGSTGATGTAGV